jgi:hypothetical protein
MSASDHLATPPTSLRFWPAQSTGITVDLGEIIQRVVLLGPGPPEAEIRPTVNHWRRTAPART